MTAVDRDPDAGPESAASRRLRTHLARCAIGAVVAYTARPVDRAVLRLLQDLPVPGALSVALQQTVNALSIGAIYALIALGYTMVYGIIELINFAHGDIFMLGAFAVRRLPRRDHGPDRRRRRTCRS